MHRPRCERLNCSPAEGRWAADKRGATSGERLPSQAPAAALLEKGWIPGPSVPEARLNAVLVGPVAAGAHARSQSGGHPPEDSFDLRGNVQTVLGGDPVGLLSERLSFAPPAHLAQQH